MIVSAAVGTLVPLVSGMLVAEGAHRLKDKKWCPAIAKRVSRSVTESSKEMPCVRIALAVVFGTVALRATLPAAVALVGGRLVILKVPLQLLAQGFGVYSLSIPFLVGVVCYFCRRDVLERWLSFVFCIYREVEEISAALEKLPEASAEVLNILIEDICAEMTGVLGVFEAITGGALPRSVTEMDSQMKKFATYMALQKEKLPEFRAKMLEKHKKLDQEVTELLARYNGNTEKISQAITKLGEVTDRISDLREGVPRFLQRVVDLTYNIRILRERMSQALEKNQEIWKQIEAGLAQQLRTPKILAGITVLERVDSMATDIFSHWVDKIDETKLNLGIIEGYLFSFIDLPSCFTKGVEYIANGKAWTNEGLYKWERQKKVLAERAPRTMQLFLKAVVTINSARNRMLKKLGSPELLDGEDLKTCFAFEGCLIEKSRYFYMQVNIARSEEIPHHWLAKVLHSHAISVHRTLIDESKRLTEQLRTQYSTRLSQLKTLGALNSADVATLALDN